MLVFSKHPKHKNMLKQRFIITFCIILASLVLLSSLRMVQVFGVALSAQRSHDDGSAIVKLAPDLHHHSDKTGVQLVKDAGDNQFYADYRTIRALRSAKKDLPYRYRLASWLQDSWLQLAAFFS
jgi:cell division protein FtsI/penicillin-binding protein 2